MKSQVLPEFWSGFGKLPPQIQRTARKNYALWQQHPELKSLEFKKIKTIFGRFGRDRAIGRWRP